MNGRRGFLGHVAGVAAVVTIGAIDPKQSLAASSRDAELLRLLAAFDDLERSSDALYPAGANPIEDDRDRSKALTRIWAQQDDLMDDICEIEAQTIEGVRARAVSLALWDKEALGGGDGDNNERMLAALLRDLVGAGGLA